jgi:transcriptional regulator with XRE-family HTH domain
VQQIKIFSKIDHTRPLETLQETLLQVSPENEIEVTQMLFQDLEALRRKANLTNKQLAQICNVSEPTISRIFSGETVDPGFSTVAAIVKACGGSLDEIGGIPRLDGKADTAALKESYESRIVEYQEEVTQLKQEKKEIEERSERHLHFVLKITAVLIVALDFIGNWMFSR